MRKCKFPTKGELEQNADKARKRTEEHKRRKKMILAEIKAITVTWKEFERGVKKMYELQQNRKITEFLNEEM